MNFKTSQETTILNPGDRYLIPFNWVATCLIHFVKYLSYCSYAGLALANLVILSPLAIYSTLNNLIFPPLTKEQLEISKEDPGNYIELLLIVAGSILKEYITQLVMELIKSSCQSEFERLLTMLTHITSQEGFWSSPCLIAWGILQTILAIPFLVLSLIIDIYNKSVLTAVILISISLAAVIYQLNSLWEKLISAPLTIYDKLSKNNSSQQQCQDQLNVDELNDLGTNCDLVNFPQIPGSPTVTNICLEVKLYLPFRTLS